jgi:hypothetical protein
MKRMGKDAVVVAPGDKCVSAGRIFTQQRAKRGGISILDCGFYVHAFGSVSNSSRL